MTLSTPVQVTMLSPVELETTKLMVESVTIEFMPVRATTSFLEDPVTTK